MRDMTSENETSFISNIRGSIVCSVVLFVMDVLLFGSYLFSILIGPIWLLVAIVRALKAIFARTSWRVAVTRIVIPLVTLALVFGNAKLQSRIAESNAERIIKACTQYRADNGVFPETLTMLVPKYLKSVPHTKYTLGMEDFKYIVPKGEPVQDETSGEITYKSTQHMLMWVVLPPFGRRTYTLETASLGHID